MSAVLGGIESIASDMFLHTPTTVNCDFFVILEVILGTRFFWPVNLGPCQGPHLEPWISLVGSALRIIRISLMLQPLLHRHQLQTPQVVQVRQLPLKDSKIAFERLDTWLNLNWLNNHWTTSACFGKYWEPSSKHIQTILFTPAR